MEVRGIVCPNCHAFVYSRTQHDYRACPCKGVAIDGGQKGYTRISCHGVDGSAIKHETREIDAGNLQDLYADWNLSGDKYGIIQE